MKSYEIEQKYRLRQPAAMRRCLEALGAVCLRRGRESNEFWDRDGQLMRQRKILRLRRVGREAWLTLKGPRMRGHCTRRFELETGVRYAETRAILRVLGYRRVRGYVKRRETYRLASCSITLDALPGFGWFMEIEASRAEKIRRMACRLGLHDKDREERSYLMMLFEGQKKWGALR